MPITAGQGGGVQNMTLKAWAYVNGTPALVRGFNVSSISKNAGTGGVVINFQQAMTSGAALVRVVLTGVAQGSIASARDIAAGSVEIACVRTSDGALLAAVPPFLVEVYE